MHLRPQQTIKRRVCYSGIGLHTGKCVTLTLCPAPISSGIVFKRVDQAGSSFVRAHAESVSETLRSTSLGQGASVVHTVEHLLAVLYAYQIDNLLIELTAEELPIADGSAGPFVELLEQAEIEEQPASQPIFSLKKPLYFSQGHTHLVALPADEFKVSYTANYPGTPLIGAQYLSLAVTRGHFKKELSACRTFVLEEDIPLLRERGLIQGGSLENAIVIRSGSEVVNAGGFRYRDEIVRHKMLDLIGDLALVGLPFFAHIIAVHSGHASNVAFGKQIREYLLELQK